MNHRITIDPQPDLSTWQKRVWYAFDQARQWRSQPHLAGLSLTWGAFFYQVFPVVPKRLPPPVVYGVDLASGPDQTRIVGFSADQIIVDDLQPPPPTPAWSGWNGE